MIMYKKYFLVVSLLVANFIGLGSIPVYAKVGQFALSIEADHGNVNIQPEQATYEYGAQVWVTVEPHYGYEFSHWSGDTGGVYEYSANRYVNIYADVSLTAHFKDIRRYHISVSVSANAGYIEKYPNSNDGYEYGTEVTLSAMPYSGYKFDYWGGFEDSADRSSTITVTIEKDMHLEAYFEELYTLYAQYSGNGTVLVSPLQYYYDYGTVVQLEAVPMDGYVFTYWSGDGYISNENDANATLTIYSNTYITANFEEQLTLTVEANHHGIVTIHPEKDYYEYRETVQLEATPNEGYTFVYWRGNAAYISDPYNSRISIDIENPTYITANFEEIFPPVADDIYYIVGQDTTYTITPKVTYTYGNYVILSIAEAPVNGEVTTWAMSNGETTFAYMPDEGFTGDDQFSFTMNDGWEDSDIVTVYVNVQAPSDPEEVLGLEFVTIGNPGNPGDDTFYVGKTGPTVRIISPANGSVINNDTPLLEYILENPDSAATVMVDDSIVNKTSGELLDWLSEGMHTIRVEATDSEGNTVFNMSTFSVEAGVPAIRIISPANGLVTSDLVHLLEYTVDDPDATVVVRVDDSIVDKTSGETLDMFYYGTRTVSVEAINSANPEKIGLDVSTFYLDAPEGHPWYGIPILGAVPYEFRITKYEITREQYLPFLNAADPFGTNEFLLWNLYDFSLDITQSPGHRYSLLTEEENLPVELSWYAVARYMNWLDYWYKNDIMGGPGSSEGDDLSGVYDTRFFDDTDLSNDPDGHNSGSICWINTFDEWYKVAYWNPLADQSPNAPFDWDNPKYWRYPNASNTEPRGGFPGVGYGNMIDSGRPKNPSPLGKIAVGSYTTSQSIDGLFDLCGNVYEWTEDKTFPTTRSPYEHGRFTVGGKWIWFPDHTERYSQIFFSTHRRSPGPKHKGGFRISTQ